MLDLKLDNEINEKFKGKIVKNIYFDDKDIQIEFEDGTSIDIELYYVDRLISLSKNEDLIINIFKDD